MIPHFTPSYLIGQDCMSQPITWLIMEFTQRNKIVLTTVCKYGFQAKGLGLWDSESN